MNNMEMERVTEDALAGYGMVVAREQLKAGGGEVHVCMRVCVHANVSRICMPTHVCTYIRAYVHM